MMGKVVGHRRWALAVAMLLQLPRPSFASDSIEASAISRYEYNSNVFDVQSGYPVPGTTDFQHSDSLFTYGAALDMNYLWSQQKLFALMSLTEFHYDRFTQLDHHEYNLDGGLNWKIGSALDGTLEVLRNYSMVPFSNAESATFSLQTEQRESAKIGLEFLSDWRIEASGRYHTVDQSAAQSQGVNLTESYGEAALKYIGRAGLSAGLSGGYTSGNYEGSSADSNFSYRQTNVALVAAYEATGRSTFNGALGYSDRTSPSALNTVSGFTGELDYSYQLTGKTSMQMRLSRVINSYVANAGSEIDTQAGLSARWQATYKLGVEAGFTWTTRNLPDQGDAPVGGDRIDHDELTSIKIDYEALRWLTIKPYVSLESRSSNFVGPNVIGANFKSAIYGVYFTARWQDQPQKK
jgi:hypothetical protein